MIFHVDAFRQGNRFVVKRPDLLLKLPGFSLFS